jgi:hypothetical protein
MQAAERSQIVKKLSLLIGGRLKVKDFRMQIRKHAWGKRDS